MDLEELLEGHGIFTKFNGELKSFFFGVRILNMAHVNKVNVGFCSCNLILLLILLDVISVDLGTA